MSGGRRVERQPSRGPRRAPGRRSSAAGDAARRRPRTGGRRSGLPALLPALAALLVLLAALVGTSDDPGEAPRAVPVQETRYACAGGPGLVTGQVEAGRSASARLSPGGDEVAEGKVGERLRPAVEYPAGGGRPQPAGGVLAVVGGDPLDGLRHEPPGGELRGHVGHRLGEEQVDESGRHGRLQRLVGQLDAGRPLQAG